MQKKKLEWRNLLSDIGDCRSLKGIGKYDLILEKLRPHPNFENKTKNIQDIEIRRNPRGNLGYELVIIYKNGQMDPISWHKAVEGKKSSNGKSLIKCMRDAIMHQIFDFKKNNKFEKCGNPSCVCPRDIADEHVDHIIPFTQLVEDFLKNNNLKVPQFFDCVPGTSILAFKSQDILFQNAWKDYHLRNAKLRYLCKTCNLKRSKDGSSY